jgi:hypothetical protein
MIDHDTARRSLGTSLDFAIEPAERDALDAHLRDCPACRSFAAATRSDAATLRELDFGPVPIAVRANVAIAAERRRGGTTGRWVAFVAVGALLLVALGGGVLGVGGGASKPNVGGNPIRWTTNVVELQAADFWIEANGQRFTATGVRPDVRSDPGDATYRTLEVTWKEHAVEMRLNLYFTGDAATSWVNEVRIYDGNANGNWLTANGRFAAAPLGATWAGDLDLQFIGAPGVAGGPARLHVAQATLRSIPFDGVTEPVGNAIALAENDRPFASGGPLHCSGILQMAPKEAELTLLKLGYKLSWRFERTTGPNTGYAEAMARAPDGVIHTEGLAGSGGELIMFVAANDDPMAKPVPFPSDCPQSDPNLTPPPPAP